MAIDSNAFKYMIAAIPSEQASFLEQFSALYGLMRGTEAKT
tara:strand:- start:917 stop:1039 length:123 start_codon:yes stop_codon:yes gene_type:complete